MQDLNKEKDQNKNLLKKKTVKIKEMESAEENGKMLRKKYTKNSKEKRNKK